MIRLEKVSTEFIETEDNGTWLFEVPDFGDWTVSASKNNDTSTKVISVTTISLYNVTVSASKNNDTSTKVISVTTISLYNVTLSYFEATILICGGNLYNQRFIQK